MTRICGILIATLVAGASSLARAQQPTPPTVRSTATVEVLDDSAHIDEVISRMKNTVAPPTNAKGDRPSTASDPNSMLNQLKSDRPDLSDDQLDKDKLNQLLRAERRRQNQRIERLRALKARQ
jgi:hypothetical protein